MEDKHQMHYIMIKTRGFYNQALMLRLSFNRSVSKHVCHTLMNQRSNISLCSQHTQTITLCTILSKLWLLLLYANFLDICSTRIFSTNTSMEDGYIYRGEEEVRIPTIVEGMPYPLGGFPIRWKQEAKGGRPWLFSRTTPYVSSTKLLL